MSNFLITQKEMRQIWKFNLRATMISVNQHAYQAEMKKYLYRKIIT